jgi:hypothetical protein
MPTMPRTRPIRPDGVMRSMPTPVDHHRGKAGCCRRRDAAHGRSDSGSGEGSVRPGCPATVVAPTTASGHHRPNASPPVSLRGASASRIALAIRARTRPHQPSRTPARPSEAAGTKGPR